MLKRIRFQVVVAMGLGLAGLTWGAISLATAAAQAQEITVTRNPLTSPADVAAGAKTFRSHCAPCHGLNGEGAHGKRNCFED